MTAADTRADPTAHPQPSAAQERASGLRTIRRVAPYLWPADKPWVRQRVVLAIVMLVAAKVVAVITPFFYKAAVDALAGEGAAWMLAIGAVGLTVVYGLTRLMEIGFQELRNVLFTRVGQRALRQLALETFEHIHRLSLRYHITRKTGGLSRIIERGVKGVDFLLRFLLFSIFPLILQLLMIMAIFFWLFDIWYLVTVVVTISLYVWFTFRVTEWRVTQRRIMNQQDTDANQKAIDSLLNFETVKYFNAENLEARRYDSAMERYEEAAVKTNYSLAFLNFGQAFLITSGLVIVMVLAAIGVARGDLTVGDFVMVNAYMIQITMPLNFLGTVYREIRQALVDMAEMFDLLDQPPDVRDAPDARPLNVSRGEIAFEAVEFGYDPARRILKGISLRVAGGETVAIVGPSGSGKSTIGRLLFRFYDVTGGAIRIDGQDLRAVSQASLHAAIGVVPQDTVLFNESIGYNIAYGRPGASQEEIQQAVRLAHLDDFIQRLPRGLDTVVGERGLKVSGGEKQRIAIARMLLKDPPILVFDEATSSLDSGSEKAILAALNEVAARRTTLVIAHRLSTVMDADNIVVLEHGRVVEQGTHDQLLTRDGAYRRLWQHQLESASKNSGPADDPGLDVKDVAMDNMKNTNKTS